MAGSKAGSLSGIAQLVVRRTVNPTSSGSNPDIRAWI
jgi:hypothetical protein